MQLHAIEQLALAHLLPEQPTEQQTDISCAVVSREHTRQGFYSIIQAPRLAALLQRLGERQWDCGGLLNSAAGFIICWPESDDTVCLEAVAENGHWPSEWLPPSQAH